MKHGLEPWAARRIHDLGDLMPTSYQPNKITAHAATAVLFEIAALIADRFRSGA